MASGLKDKGSYNIADIIGLTPFGEPYTEDDERNELQKIYDSVKQIHIPVWEDVVGGRVVFLPGSGARAQKISELFSHREVHGAERGIVAYTGTIDDIPVLTMASGMGSGQTEIIGLELMRAMRHKGGAIIRYGSVGALKPVPTVRVGDLLLAKWAFCADSSFAWMTDEQIASGNRVELDVGTIMYLEAALHDAGYLWQTLNPEAALRYHEGGTQSKALLYAQEMCLGPRGRNFARLKRAYEAFPELDGTEMETALLYTIGNRLIYLVNKFESRTPFFVGSLNFFIGDSDNSFHPESAVREKAEQNLINTVPYVARHMYPAVKAIPPREF